MQIDEEAIELAELFAEQGRFDEAQAILNEQLLRTPNHPLVLEQLADLEAARQAMEPAPASPAAGAPPGYPPAPGPVSRPRGAAPAHHRVSGADAATHYDLGVAYHEMGLHAEAMAELELAARDPERECVSLSMMGVIHLGLGDVDNALEALVRAMTSERKTPEQRLALGYELGGAYEVKGLHDQARECFTWLAQQAPSYDDPRGSVAERLARLRPGQSGAVRRPETLGEGPPSSRDGIDGFRRGG
ncbi:MAG: tetratricopeptide repeat protein [Deltaproteobacteria bacterium]|nr:tetratricopeptide repeat protein [Deltaproteobacteria bacterium]